MSSMGVGEGGGGGICYLTEGSADRKSWKASEIQSFGMLSKVLLHRTVMALPPSGRLSTAVMRNGGYQCLVSLPEAFMTKQRSSCSTNVIVQIKS
jgi:hypothetical protein